MEYKDQFISDLRLTLVSGAIDHDGVELLDHKNVIVEGLIVISLGVIGASHVIGFNVGGKDVFSEIIANYDIKQCTYNNHLEYSVITDGISYSGEGLGGGVIKSYRVESEVVDYCDENLGLVKEFNKGYSSCMVSHKVSYKFLGDGNESDQGITALYLDVCDGMVSIHTIHTYPNECKSLITRTMTSIIL